MAETSLLSEGQAELKKLKQFIETTEQQLLTGQKEVSLAAVGTQSKLLTQIFKQLAASDLAKSAEHRSHFTQFSTELKELLLRLNNIRLQRASTTPAPAVASSLPNAQLALSTPSPFVSSLQTSTQGPVEAAGHPLPGSMQITDAGNTHFVTPEHPHDTPHALNTASEISTVEHLVSQPNAQDLGSNDARKPQRKFVLKGWLRKQGEVGLKTWKRRYFRFKDGKLLYFADEQDLKPKGWIDLSTMISCAIDEAEKFSITCTNRVWHLQAERERDAQNWIKALQLWSQRTQILHTRGNSGDEAIGEQPETTSQLTLVQRSVPDHPAGTAIPDRKRQRDQDNERQQREREIREMQRQQKLEAALRARATLERDEHSVNATVSASTPRVLPEDINALRSKLQRLQKEKEELRRAALDASARLADLGAQTRPSAGLPILMQLQAQLASRKDIMRQVWTPAVQQYHTELSTKQHQLLDIRAKEKNQKSLINSIRLHELNSQLLHVEGRAKVADATLNDLVFDKSHKHPANEVSTKEQVRALVDKKTILLEALSANSIQLGLMESNDDIDRAAEVHRVAKLADTILTHRANLLLARSRFQQLRMRCNMSWTGSSLLTYKEELSMLLTEYAQALITNVKLHMIQQTGALPRLNIESLIGELLSPNMISSLQDWPKYVSDHIYNLR